MSDFMDVGQFHKNETSGKWRFQRLGYAKPNKNGDGWDIYLDALPMPTSTGCRLAMQPRREQQERSGGGGGSGGDPFDGGDRIPFSPSVL